MSENKATGAEKYKRIGIVAWSLVGLAAVGYILLYIMGRISVVIPVFVYTVALAYLLRPPVEYLSKRKVPRALAVLITYVAVLIIITIFLLYVVPIILSQAFAFITELPEIIESVQGYIQRFVTFYQARLGGTPLDIQNAVDQVSRQISTVNIPNAISGVFGATANLLSGALNFILAPILAFFILKDLPRIKETFISLVPEKHRLEWLDIIAKVNKVLSGFLKGQLLVALFVGTSATILFLILRVRFAILLGAVSGITNLIPYFGPIVGGGLAALVALFDSPLKALFVIIGMFVIQQIESTIVAPLVMKRQVNLHPVLIVFSLLIGGSLLGVLGLLLAVPTAAVVKVLAYHFIERSNSFSQP